MTKIRKASVIQFNELPMYDKEKPLPVSRQGLVIDLLECWFEASFPTGVTHMREVALVDGIANINILGIAIATLFDLPDATMRLVSVACGGVSPDNSVVVVNCLDCCGIEQRINLLLDRRILVIHVPQLLCVLWFKRTAIPYDFECLHEHPE
jgi:hypothetical protein